MANSHTRVIDRSLISLTWPIFVDILFVFLVSVVDAWFLSRVSDTAAAAVGAVLPVSGVGFTLFVNLAAAGNSVASQRIGSGDYSRLSGTYGCLLLIGLIVGALVATLMVTMAPHFARWMGLQGELAGMGSRYLQIMGFGACLLAVRYAASAILTSQGKTHWNMWSTALMTAANLFLNYAFVYGKFGLPAMGLEGVAVASCIAWGVSLFFTLFAIIFIQRIKIEFPFRWANFKRLVKPILGIGVPSVVEPLSWHFSQLFIIAMVVQLGEMMLATRVYAFNILFVVALFGTALSAGVQLKVSHFVGAGRFDDAHSQLLQGLRLGLAGAISIVAFIYIFSDYFFGVFTSNQDIIALGSSVVAVALFCEIGRILNLVVGASLKASGDAKYLSLCGFGIMWLVAVPLAWLIGVHWAFGLVGIWVAMSIDEIARGLVALVRWNSRKWERKGVYCTAEPAEVTSC